MDVELDLLYDRHLSEINKSSSCDLSDDNLTWDYIVEARGDNFFWKIITKI